MVPKFFEALSCQAPSAPVFIDGEKATTLRGENVAQEFVGLLDAYVAKNYIAR